MRAPLCPKLELQLFLYNVLLYLDISLIHLCKIERFTFMNTLKIGSANRLLVVALLLKTATLCAAADQSAGPLSLKQQCERALISAPTQIILDGLDTLHTDRSGGSV